MKIAIIILSILTCILAVGGYIYTHKIIEANKEEKLEVISKKITLLIYIIILLIVVEAVLLILRLLF